MKIRNEQGCVGPISGALATLVSRAGLAAKRELVSELVKAKFFHKIEPPSFRDHATLVYSTGRAWNWSSTPFGPALLPTETSFAPGARGLQAKRSVSGSLILR